MAHDVFISYPHQNKATADAACAKLEAQGIRCWIAPRDIAPGGDWAEAIVEAIEQCRAMVLIFSSSCNGSKQIHREVQQAFDEEKPVIPFRVENVEPAKSLRYYMGPVHWLDALTLPLEQHLEKLAASVGHLLRIEPSTPRARENNEATETDTAVESKGASAPRNPGLYYVGAFLLLTGAVCLGLLFWSLEGLDDVLSGRVLHEDTHADLIALGVILPCTAVILAAGYETMIRPNRVLCLAGCLTAFALWAIFAWGSTQNLVPYKELPITKVILTLSTFAFAIAGLGSIVFCVAAWHRRSKYKLLSRPIYRSSVFIVFLLALNILALAGLSTVALASPGYHWGAVGFMIAAQGLVSFRCVRGFLNEFGSQLRA
jgi:hypothetical protein